MINDSKPTSSIIDSSKVSISETWNTILTTWNSETRTWNDLFSLIVSDPRVSSNIINASKP